MVNPALTMSGRWRPPPNPHCFATASTVDTGIGNIARLPTHCSVASLGWVSPGAATEGVIPIFSGKKSGDLFCSSLSLLLILLGCHPLGGCHPTPFSPIQPRFNCPQFFVNLRTNFFPSGVTTWRVSYRAVRPPPTSDATDTDYCDNRSLQRRTN